MKKGSKALVNLNRIQLGQVFQAMQNYRGTLNPLNQKLFDIPFKAIAKQVDLQSCRELEFDGMEMKLICEALAHKGDFLIKAKQFKAAVKYFKLHNAIRNEREKFQKENGPQIKIAPTAGTVDASA